MHIAAPAAKASATSAYAGLSATKVCWTPAYLIVQKGNHGTRTGETAVKCGSSSPHVHCAGQKGVVQPRQFSPGAVITANDKETIGTPMLPSSMMRLLRLPEVCRITGLGRAMIYRLQARDSFPHSVKITDHAVGWIDSEVQAWLAQRAALSRVRSRAIDAEI